MQTTFLFNFLLNDASIISTNDVDELEKIASNIYKSISLGNYLETILIIEDKPYKITGINIIPIDRQINIDLEVKN
jgi:hypothetical protein